MDGKINVNEKEIELIKRTFNDNEPLLKSIRALFLGLVVTQEEKKIIKDTFTSPELRAIMWKRFCPMLDRDTPIGQVQDVWLGAEQMVFNQPKNTIRQAITYKHEAVETTKRALKMLENPDENTVDVSYAPNLDKDPLQTGLLARNQFIRHVEQQLLFLKVIADQKNETPEQTKKRIAQNSTQ